MYCRTAKTEGSTECFDGSATFSYAALLAFVIIAALGIATCFRRLCTTYDTKYFVEVLSGQPISKSGDTSV